MGDTATTHAVLEDRSYRPFTGRRTGVASAVRSVAWAGFRHVLGLGRPARYKVLPIVTIVLSYIPAIVFLGITILVSSVFDDDLDGAGRYGDYLGTVVLAVLLFTAIAAPAVLTEDRRNGMGALYLTTSLSRTSYLAARALSLVWVLAAVTVGPLLLTLVGYTFIDLGPNGVLGWLATLGRIALNGAAVAGMYSALALCVASMSDRLSVAAVAIFAVVIGGTVLAEVLVEVADYSESIYLISVPYVTTEVGHRFFGDTPNRPEISTAAVYAATVGWTLLPASLAWWRYQRIRLER